MTPSLLLCCGLLLWATAGLIISNEYNARRAEVPTIVSANIFAAVINLLVGAVLVLMSTIQLFSR